MTTRANAEQAERWGGAAGRHWVDHEARYDRQLEPYGDALVAAAGLSSTERVLDVGCGTGTTALAAAGAAGEVLGVDLSAPMIERARDRARAAGRSNVRFDVADAQTTLFGGPFEVVVSRFGVMFFDDPHAAFTNLRRAVAPGGRLVVMCWQGLERNDWMRVPGEALARVVDLGDLAEPGQPGPFSLGAPDRVASILRAAGWSAVALEDFSAPVLIGGGGSLDEAVTFVRGGSLGRCLDGRSSETEQRGMEALRVALAPFVIDAGVTLPGAAWVVHATAGPVRR